MKVEEKRRGYSEWVNVEQAPSKLASSWNEKNCKAAGFEMKSG